ncbi:SCO1664 family protein [Aeromicrobium tamlense]|uniref:Repeat protein (TIGR03843 family) n=1 Tax=Aeromicrobium tamlense TaxID=375541 RepID=A0ABX2SMQ5_9ACTN|nr:SCO1664 family protein [Aeromicrobium tamlense]NYI38707.1 putative repeat protein (TIGR03843 family) [Aeromicrobium tamlense]
MSLEGDLELEGRILPASNATFVGRIDGVRVVYKPVAGERPLWDFPDVVLAKREVASRLVSEATGWDVVPPTWWGEGPHGPGMLQVWQDADPEAEAVTLVPADDLPDGWCHVLDGLDAEDRPVSLVHEDSAGLRRMAVFDAMVNNADRKGGHVLAMTGGHRHGVDHGLTFHEEPKLRTVLWGWLGQALSEDELAGVRRVCDGLDAELGTTLAEWLGEPELAALRRRCDRLLAEGVFPSPEGDMPAVPWPPF